MTSPEREDNTHCTFLLPYREYNEGPSNDASSMGKSGDGQQTLSVPRDQSPSTSHSSLLSTGESRLV